MESTLDILLAHNAWATRRMLAVCEKLTAEQFHERFDIGLGSLHDTLLHIVGAMQRWSDRIAEVPLRPSPEAEKRPRTPRELLAMLDEASQALRSAAEGASATGEGLAARFAVTFGGHEPLVFTRGAALVHVTTHGMHHRAQALNMLRRLGVSDLVDEIDALDWELAEGPQAA